MSGETYPNLGFDPCKGAPESVSALRSRVVKAAASMQEANVLLHRLRADNSPVWQGSAGDAFRAHLDTTVIDDLGRANVALNKAVGVLNGWGMSLAGFKQRAGLLEREAADAVKRLEAAQQAYGRTTQNPDLLPGGAVFGTDEALQQALRKRDAAALAVRNALVEQNAAEDHLEGIRRRARDLSDEWDDAANRAAASLKDAAEFAPHKPGFLAQVGLDFKQSVSEAGDWVMDHLDEIHSVLSSISAVSAVVAHIAPPPIKTYALAVSAVASLGALATTLADPKIRRDIGEMLHGDFEGNIGSGVQLGGDLISTIPGGKFALGLTSNLVKSSAGGKSVTEIAETVIKDPGFAVKELAKIPGAGSVASKLESLVKMPQYGSSVAERLSPYYKSFTALKNTGGAGVSIFGGGSDGNE